MNAINSENGWIQTFSGGEFWPRCPRPEDVRLADIAHALANICRFNGHSIFHYSVAQHAAYVADEAVRIARLIGIANPTDLAFLRLVALHHDDAEYVLGDVPRPIKPDVMIAGATFAQVEDGVQAVISGALQLPYPVSDHTHQIIKQADMAMLAAERDQVMMPSHRPWGLEVAPAPVRIEPMLPMWAERRYLKAHTDCLLELGRAL